MDALGKNNPGNWVVNAAKRLHRGRCQPDLIAYGMTMLLGETCDQPVLNVVCVGDGRQSPLIRKRFERRVVCVFSEQHVGSALSREIIHGHSPFFGEFREPYRLGCRRQTTSPRMPAKKFWRA